MGLNTGETTNQENFPGVSGCGRSARALVNEPEIILADEPTGNLDRKTGKEVLDYLLSVNERLSSTLILVTRDPEIGSIGERKLKMVDGELFTI